MAVYSMNLRRLLGEKKTGGSGKMNVKTNIKMVDVSKADDNSLKVEFLYQTEYEPDFGLIEIAGDLYYSSEKEEISKLAAQWEKDKKLDEDVSLKVLNRIFSRASIEAAILAKEINLPAPFSLPKFAKKEKAE